MRIDCPTCSKSYQIPDEKLPIGKKVSFHCPNCKEKIKLDLQTTAKEVTPDLSEPLSLSPTDAAKQGANSAELKDRILRTLKELPAMPQVVLEAREIMGNEDSGIEDVIKVLETDQAITTKILKAANSAYYGRIGKIATIQQASVVLGFKTIAELITLASSSSLLDRVLRGYGLGADALWRHSLSVAIGSRIIADRKRPDLAETSFSAGLIHDAGKLVLDQYVMEKKGEFEEIMNHGQVSFMEAEEHIFGFNHAEIGFDVCNHWKIPEDISIAVKHHHAPSRSNYNAVAYVVYLADAIVNMADSLAKMDSMSAGMDAMMYMLDDRAMEFIGIQEDDVQPIVDEIEKSVAEMAGGMA